MAFEKMDVNIFVERTGYCFSWGKKINCKGTELYPMKEYT